MRDNKNKKQSPSKKQSAHSSNMAPELCWELKVAPFSSSSQFHGSQAWLIILGIKM